MIVIHTTEPDFEAKVKASEGWTTPFRRTIKTLHYKMKDRMEFLCMKSGTLTLGSGKPVCILEDGEKPEEKYCQTCRSAIKVYKITGQTNRDFETPIKSYERIEYPTEPEPFKIKETHWIKAQCSHMDGKKRCPETGIYPTYNPERKRDHFCQTHNPRIVTA